MYRSQSQGRRGPRAWCSPAGERQLQRLQHQLSLDIAGSQTKPPQLSLYLWLAEAPRALWASTRRKAQGTTRTFISTFPSLYWAPQFISHAQGGSRQMGISESPHPCPAHPDTALSVLPLAPAWQQNSPCPDSRWESSPHQSLAVIPFVPPTPASPGSSQGHSAVESPAGAALGACWQQPGPGLAL